MMNRESRFAVLRFGADAVMKMLMGRGHVELPDGWEFTGDFWWDSETNGLNCRVWGPDLPIASAGAVLPKVMDSSLRMESYTVETVRAWK